MSDELCDQIGQLVRSKISQLKYPLLSKQSIRSRYMEFMMDLLSSKSLRNKLDICRIIVCKVFENNLKLVNKGAKEAYQS